MGFSDVVEVIKRLSTGEKHEIHLLLEQYLREDHQDEIHTNFKLAQAEQLKNELTFSSNINDLRQVIED